MSEVVCRLCDFCTNYESHKCEYCKHNDNTLGAILYDNYHVASPCEYLHKSRLNDFQKDCCCENREWTTGAKRGPNDGKGRMDLLPWNAIIEISKHCQKGAEHYGEHNVDKGIPLSSLCDSGARHLAKFMDGWTDEDHLVAAAWNILWAVQMRNKKPEMIDIPWEDKH